MVHDVAQVETTIYEFAPEGQVLELACGTGIFTQYLAQHAQHITAVDTSPEAIALNRARLPGASVEYVVADIFAWSFPRSAYDAVVFTYWLSHVPDDHLDTFWKSVHATLKPGGRVFLVDSSSLPSISNSNEAGGTERRTISTGRSFTVLKRYWRPDELEEYLAAAGFACQAQLTDNHMILSAGIHST